MKLGCLEIASVCRINPDFDNMDLFHPCILGETSDTPLKIKISSI